MYNDGIIGNLGIIEVLGTLTAGQFNKMLPVGKQPYTLQKIIPKSYGYLYPELDEKTKQQMVNEQLIAFASLRPMPDSFKKDF
jgi:hypothetical protein